MSTDLEQPIDEQDFADDLPPERLYRALSPSAVASLAAGLLSGLAFLDWWIGMVPMAGIALGMVALRRIRTRPDELTGAPLAAIGLALSVICLVGSWSWLGYVYATEVPDGYERIGYEELQPDPDVVGEFIPPSIAELDGKQVFIKGYVYPDGQQSGITEFTLCRDKGDCCFGGNPKITERIHVTLTDPEGVSFSPWQFKVAGVFRIRPPKGPQKLGSIYHLDEAQVVHQW